MKLGKGFIYYTTLTTCLLCLNLGAIASNNASGGPFDIPSRTDHNINDANRELHSNLRAGNIPSEFTDRILKATKSQNMNSNPKTKPEKEEARKQRNERFQQRRESAKKIIAEHQPDVGQVERMTDDDIRRVYGNAVKKDPLLEEEDNKWLRSLTRHLGSSETETLADPSVEYDSWAQGYRMLGGYIDCDAQKDQGSHDNGGGNNGGQTCSRWMMWAAYVNPNYQDGGRGEYFSNSNYYGETTSSLDCHSPKTEWQLLGVYREEFYQYIEQISKHMWAIDDYEYVVALAGLAYMTDEDCYGVGYDNNGDYIYAGVQPTSGGKFEMGLYSDNMCLTLDESSGLTFDSFGLGSDMDLGSKDDGSLSDDTLYNMYQYWQNAQEYTLTLLNEVYEEFKYCTLCMDYPTYQDGYFIGDYGTDDDDLINQCWKFHSHDSFTCEESCIAMGHTQGSITNINYLGTKYGQTWDGSSSSTGSTTTGSQSSSTNSSGSDGYTSSGSSTSKFSRFKANAYLTFNGVLFIATFLAFSVARGSRDRKSDKKKSLLSREERRAAKSPRSSSSKRSKKGSKSVSSKGSKKSGTRSASNGRSSSARSSSGKSSGSAARSSSRSKSGQKKRSSSNTKRVGTYA